MFKCFFPRPSLFFPSAIVWIILCTVIWFWLGEDIASLIGINFQGNDDPIIGLGYFVTPKFIWFYIILHE